MTKTVSLRSIAHARAGDKGNRSNVSLFVYDPKLYPVIKEQVTPERLKSVFPDLLKGRVQRFELDDLNGLNFVMDQALEGGVNGSLNLDAHGKSWSFLLLGLTIDLDQNDLS